MRADWIWRLLAMIILGASLLVGGCDQLLEGDRMAEADDDNDDSRKKKKKKKKKKGKKKKKKKRTASARGHEVRRSDFDWACAVHPETKGSIYLPVGGEHGSSKEAEVAKLVRDLLKELTEPAGIPPGSIPPVFVEPAVGGNVAAALVLRKKIGPYKKGQRVIMFAPKQFVDHVKSSGSKKTISFIFAHEMGHHINGHLGHRPDQSDHSAELEADYYAGFLLGARGDSLKDATAWINAKVPLKDSKTHPGRVKRLKSAKRGWDKGCKQSKKCSGPTELDLPDDPNKPDKPDPPKKDGKLRSYSDRKNQ